MLVCYLVDSDYSKDIVERYSGQMEGLYNLTHFSGIEGLDVECMYLLSLPIFSSFLFSSFYLFSFHL